MKQTLVINFGEYEFTNFDRTVKALEEEYGYEGLAWDMVVASNVFEILADFLVVDEIDAEVVSG